MHVCVYFVVVVKVLIISHFPHDFAYVARYKRGCFHRFFFYLLLFLLFVKFYSHQLCIGCFVVKPYIIDSCVKFLTLRKSVGFFFICRQTTFFLPMFNASRNNFQNYSEYGRTNKYTPIYIHTISNWWVRKRIKLHLVTILLFTHTFFGLLIYCCVSHYIRSNYYIFACEMHLYGKNLGHIQYIYDLYS